MVPNYGKVKKMTRFLYMESSPQLKGKARDFGKSYRRMAIVEVEEGFEGRPSMISERARGVVRIVDDYTESVGKTDRSEGFRTRRDLMAKADKLNAAAK